METFFGFLNTNTRAQEYMETICKVLKTSKNPDDSLETNVIYKDSSNKQFAAVSAENIKIQRSKINIKKINNKTFFIYQPGTDEEAEKEELAIKKTIMKEKQIEIQLEDIDDTLLMLNQIINEDCIDELYFEKKLRNVQDWLDELNRTEKELISKYNDSTLEQKLADIKTAYEIYSKRIQADYKKYSHSLEAYNNMLIPHLREAKSKEVRFCMNCGGQTCKYVE